MLPGCAVSPPPIQVSASDVGPIVAVNDSVGIDHRHNFEDECLSELSGGGAVTDEKVNDSPAHEG